MGSINVLKTAASALLMAKAITADTTTGPLSILSFNVAGLPSILQDNGESGDKTTNSELIGTYFSEYDYDVIHVQEDFNYHASIYKTDTHPYRTATSGGAAIGSGLNTLANYPWVDFTRIKWDECSNDESADCLTPKGFTFMRMQVTPTTDNSTATFIDFYNLHADAGTTAADEESRNSNINQVLAYVNTWSVGNAVIIYGDTNARYTRVLDTSIVGLLDAGFTDPFVEIVRDGVIPTVEVMCQNPQAMGNTTCEVVDKVFYRGSPLVTLAAESFDYVGSLFLSPNGTTLSDHDPINVNFTWTAGTALRQSGFWGGPHGTWFSDVETLAALSNTTTTTTTPTVSKIILRGANRLDSVGVTLSDGTNLTHGGTGGTESTLALAADEFWTSATLCQGLYDSHTRNFYMLATTSAGKTVTAGTKTSDCATFTAPDGWTIVGFLGQDGDELDQLGFIYAPQ